MIKSFNREEKIALVAILRFIASSDGRITEGEIEKFDQIAEKKGFEDFSEIFNEVDNEVHSIDDIKKLIKMVERDTHKYDILKYAIELSVADSNIVPEEVEILKIMGKEWNVDIKSVLKGN